MIKVKCNMQVVVYLMIYSLRKNTVLLLIPIVEDSVLRRGLHLNGYFAIS